MIAIANFDVTPAELLDFWFSEDVKKKWFKPDGDFDRLLKDRFGEACLQARSAALASWAEAAESSVALIILLDQIPRNIFRDTPAAFAGDELALETARHAIAKGFESQLEQMPRYMLYMPFMHSESLDVQEEGVKLFTQLGLEEPLRYMKLHRDIIVRFGRFPHRNEILGRESTAEELEFLAGPNSSF